MAVQRSYHSHDPRPVDPMAITTLLNSDNGQQQSQSSPISWSTIPPERHEYEHGYVRFARTGPYPVDYKSTIDSESAREKRDSYNEDQKYFIWYHRIVLGRSWERIEKDFLDHFGQRRSKSGLQCRFYRVLSEKGSGKVRDKPQSNNRCLPGGDNRYEAMERSDVRLN